MAERKVMRIPRYIGLRIYVLSTLLYLFLVLPILLILLAKYGPEWLESRNISLNDRTADSTAVATAVDGLPADSIPTGEDRGMITIQANDGDGQPPINITSQDVQLDSGFRFLIRMLILAFLLAFLFNLPFKIYFHRKRKNKHAPAKLEDFCRKWLLRTPLVNALILGLAFLAFLTSFAVDLFFNKTSKESIVDFHQNYLLISIIASSLSVLFVYFWQKNRVHHKYIEHVFPESYLRKWRFSARPQKIHYRLWISSAMTTILPLFIVIFYIFLSITSVKDLGIEKLNEDQIQILAGKYLAYFSYENNDSLKGLFYVNVFDSLMMMVGIFTGIISAIFYLLFFVNWTTRDIMLPVNELLGNMQLVGAGDYRHFNTVRTRDELGKMAAGFNEMTQKIRKYVADIQRINEANSRFVPNQFIHALNKKSITEVRLGDQVQKEMTILFSDIRDFTGVSEQMTPKENFDFLNTFLGYMEPVIRMQNGFIDKFIGDSIMALFEKESDFALEAALDMRERLDDFNELMLQTGKPQINLGIGLHTGTLMLGVVGGEGRMESTVISDAVNLAARLEGLTKIYGSTVIISEDTLISLSDPSKYQYRFLDVVKVKGKKKAVYIFEILDAEADSIRTLKIETKNLFSEGIQLYKDQQFEKAQQKFEAVLLQNASDTAAQLYLKRCKSLIRNGVPEGWDGITVMEVK